MPTLRIPLPSSVNPDSVATALSPSEAALIQNLDISTAPGRLARGKGWARSTDFEAHSFAVRGVFVATQRNCKKIAITSDTNGVVRAYQGQGLFSTGGIPSCHGPKPDFNDSEPLDGQQVTIVSSLWNPNVGQSDYVAPVSVFTGALAGKYYRIRAVGIWTSEVGGAAWKTINADGDAVTGNTSAGEFSGASAMYFGSFAVKLPGASDWTKNGVEKLHYVTTAGNIVGAFADNISVYSDNGGFMTVIAEEVV